MGMLPACGTKTLTFWLMCLASLVNNFSSKNSIRPSMPDFQILRRNWPLSLHVAFMTLLTSSSLTLLWGIIFRSSLMILSMVVKLSSSFTAISRFSLVSSSWPLKFALTLAGCTWARLLAVPDHVVNGKLFQQLRNFGVGMANAMKRWPLGFAFHLWGTQHLTSASFSWQHSSEGSVKFLARNSHETKALEYRDSRTYAQPSAE